MSGLDLSLSLSMTGRSSGLASSYAMTASGPGITCVLQADGSYLVTTDGTCTANSYAATVEDALAGDYLIEVDIITHGNGVGGGADNAAPAARGLDVFDECLYPDAGFGAGKINLYKNNVPDPTNIAFTDNLYMERVGTDLKVYNGATWPAAYAGGAIITSTAVDGNARCFQFFVQSAGTVAQWAIRAIDHP